MKDLRDLIHDLAAMPALQLLALAEQAQKSMVMPDLSELHPNNDLNSSTAVRLNEESISRRLMGPSH